MPKIFGELQSATLENLSADPAAGVAGRVIRNTTENRFKMDDGTGWRAMLRNDSKCVFGNAGTANNNIRFHRGANSVLQFVLGGDVTVEGTLSTSLAQTSSRHENYTNAGLPAAGNAGRVAYVTDLGLFKGDNGTIWTSLLTFDSISPLTTKGDIVVFNGTANVRQPVGGNGLFLKANSATATGLEYASPSGTKAVTTKTTTYSATLSDDVIFADPTSASFTITLPTPVGNDGKIIEIMRVMTTEDFTKVITVATAGGSFTDSQGFTTASLTVRSNGEVLICTAVSGVWRFRRTIPGPLVQYVPTYTGFTSSNAFSSLVTYQRNGGNLRVRGGQGATATSGSLLTISLPSGLHLDGVSVANGFAHYGNLYVATGTGTAIPSTTRGAFVITSDSGGTDTKVGVAQSTNTSTNGFVTAIGSAVIPATPGKIMFDFEIPIFGWDYNG